MPRFELPEPSPSLDPDSVKLGPVRYLCNQWFNGPAPDGPTVILDAYFPGDSGFYRNRPLRSRDLKAIGAAGGSVGYLFNFAAARIKIAPERVAELVGRTNTVLYGVPDLRRYDWRVGVRFSRPLTPSDFSTFASLGGRLISSIPSISVLIGNLPDRSLPTLRAQDGVREVSADYHFCNE